MSLDLDARQRAMLQEMGITVFAAPARAAAHPAPSARAAQPAAPGAQPAHAPSPPSVTQRGDTAAAPPPAAPRATVAAAPAPGVRTESGTLLLHPAVPLYPQADPAATPPELGSGWLIVLESPTPQAPLAGDMGRLLDNMLRAMRLHLHPRCMAATLQRAGPGAQGTPVAEGLAPLLATQRPAMVLLLGLNAARAVLGGTAPLAQLRAGAHQLADGTPAVVSHDPAHLLRAPHAKPAAWEDLCRALALVHAPPPR